MKLVVDRKVGVKCLMEEETRDKIYTAICNASIDEWAEFFEFLRQQQYPQINSAIDVEQLHKIQSNVKSFYLVESIFKDIITKKVLDK